MDGDWSAGLRARIKAPAAHYLSSLLLGILLLVIGACVLATYGGALGLWRNENYYLANVALLMTLTGGALVIGSFAFRFIRPLPGTTRALFVTVFAVLLAASIAYGTFNNRVLLWGPAPYATSLVLLLAITVALSRRSHMRALGMVLLGLLLGCVGIDIVTGTERMAFRQDVLIDGIHLPTAVLGVLVCAEALVALAAPRLSLASFHWLGLPLEEKATPAIMLAMRVLAALAIAASVLWLYALSNRIDDVVLMFVFAAFGMICKLIAWNRLALVLGLALGSFLEQFLRQALLISNGDFSTFTIRPDAANQLRLAVVVLLVAFGLWLWRVLKMRRVTTSAK
jgi:TctA family transporter